MPKVIIKDNWGWCNGSCNGAGNSGCYDSSNDTNGNNQCFDVDAGTFFSGTIIVPYSP